MKRPCIGVPTRLAPGNPRFYLRRYYTDALYASGATPLLVPLIPDPSYIDDMSTHLDGIVLSGSDSDLDPQRYGQAPHPKLGHIVPDRHEVDQLLLKAAQGRNLPVTPDRYGMQGYNITQR